MQQLNKLLDLLVDLERSASSEGCEADLMVVSAAALWDVMQAAKLIKADAANHAPTAAVAIMEPVSAAERSGMTIKRFQEIAARLLAKHYGLQLNDTSLLDELVVQDCINEGFRPYQVIAEHADEADLVRVDLQGSYGVPSKAAITEVDEDAVLVLNDRYADSIIGTHHERFDAIEVHGVSDLHEPGSPLGTCCEIDDQNPQFFSVYVHLKPSATAGGVECVGDFGTYPLAEQYAIDLSEKHRWPIHCHVKPDFKQPVAA